MVVNRREHGRGKADTEDRQDFSELIDLRLPRLTTYQFLITTQKAGKGRSFCKHLFRRRNPRLNQDTALR
jgi:hypothetical protein